MFKYSPCASKGCTLGFNSKFFSPVSYYWRWFVFAEVWLKELGNLRPNFEIKMIYFPGLLSNWNLFSLTSLSYCEPFWRNREERMEGRVLVIVYWWGLRLTRSKSNSFADYFNSLGTVFTGIIYSSWQHVGDKVRFKVPSYSFASMTKSRHRPDLGISF